MNEESYKEYYIRRGPFFEDMPYFSAGEIESYFGNQRASRTKVLVEIHYMVIIPHLKVRKVIGEICVNEQRGRHAEKIALEWAEQYLSENRPDDGGTYKGGFVTIKLYISRSPCGYCAIELESFVKRNRHYFLSVGYAVSSPDKASALGLFEIFFPHGYYQASESFIYACQSLLHANIVPDNNHGNANDMPMLKSEVIDAKMLRALTKDPLSDSFLRTYPDKFNRASAALRLAEDMATNKSEGQAEILASEIDTYENELKEAYAALRLEEEKITTDKHEVTILTEKIHDYKIKLSNASEDLRLTEDKIDIPGKIHTQIKNQKNMAGLCDIMGNMKIDDDDFTRSRSLQESHIPSYLGDLTAEVVAGLKALAEVCPVGEAVFALAVGIRGFLSHHERISDSNYVPRRSCGKRFICYMNEGRVVCLWNGYNKSEIEDIINVCDGELTKVLFWETPDGSSFKYDMFGTIQGTSVHRKYLFQLLGPILYNSSS